MADGLHVLRCSSCVPWKLRGTPHMGNPYGQQPPAAAHCANCGTQLDPSQRFCPTCGQATTGVAWQGGTTYQAGNSGAPAGGLMVPPSMPPAVPGQPPTYAPTEQATPQPGVSGPNAQPYAWTNPLQPPYAAGQQAPYGQAAPTTGAPFTPGQPTYQTPGYGGPLSSPSQYTPTYQSPGAPAPRRGPRGRLIAVIAAVCI